MKTYQITSKAGADFGPWSGATAAEALVAMHQDAGYPGVFYDDRHDRVVFPDDDTKRLCGDVWDWHFEDVSHLQEPDAA